MSSSGSRRKLHCNALLTMSGRKSYVYSALAGSSRAGAIVCVDADRDAPVQVRCSRFALVPRVADGSAYLEAVARVCEQEKIDCVVPINDLDVGLLSGASADFQGRGVRVLAPDSETTHALGDKRAAAHWLAARGFRTPETWTFEEALNRQPPLPLIAKERHGQGSAGLRLIRTHAELCTLPATAVVQPYLDGTHYDLDILRAADGTVISVVAKQKLEMSAGTASLVRSVVSDELTALGVQLATAVGHVGAIDVDLIAVGAEVHVLEINPRLGGCFPFTHVVCPEFADALLAIGLGETPPSLLGRYRDGVTVFRELAFVEVSPAG